MPWVNVFGGVNTMPGRGKVEAYYAGNNINGKAKFKSYGWNAGGGVGYSHFFNEQIALQYFVNYRYKWLKNTATYNTPSITSPDNSTKSNDFNFGVGLQIYLSRKGK